MTGAARTCRQPKRHGFQAARLIAGKLQSFDVHRPIHAVAAYFHGGTTQNFRQKSADSLALADGSDGGENSFCRAEPKTELVHVRQQSLFTAFHQPSQGSACADGIESVNIAELCRVKNAVGIANSAERAQSKKRFIFHALIPAVESFEQTFAADRASGAAMPAAEVIFGQRLSAQRISVVEGRLLKVARRQSAQAIEYRQVGDRADLPIFVGQRAQATLAQDSGNLLDAARIRHIGGTIAA